MSGSKTPSTTIRAGLVAAGLVAQLISGLPAYGQRMVGFAAAREVEPSIPAQEAPQRSRRGLAAKRLPSTLLAEPPETPFGPQRLGPGVKAGGVMLIPSRLAEPAGPQPNAAVVKAAINTGLSAVGVSPNGVSGTSQVFSLLYRDTAGANDIRSVEALINSSRVGNNACYVQYNRTNNGLYLRNDANSDWLGPITPGSSQILANSQCTLSAAGSSVNTGGTDLQLNAALTFNNNVFAGTRTIYMNLLDLANNSPADWLTAGLYNIPSLNSNSAPTVTGVTPNAGTGTSQTFSFAYADANGFADILFTEALINTTLNGSNACFIHYDRVGNGLYLRNDTNTGWSFPPVTPGVPGSASNSQCTIQGTGSSVATSGNNLTVNVNVSFTGTFTGPKNQFLIALDSALSPVNWVNAGNFTVGVPPPNQPPVALSVNPVASSGAGSTFTFTYSDPNGFGDLSYVEALFSPGTGLANSCFIHYDRGQNSLYLLNDPSTTFLGPVVVGSATTAANTQCLISGAGASVSTSGNTLSFTVPVQFASSFNGGRVIFLTAVDNAGVSSGPTNLGSFTVSSTTTTPGGTTGGGTGTGNTPFGVSATPANSGGSSQVFSFVYGDPLGFTDLSYVEALLNTSVNGAGACFLHYNRTNGSIYLRNDANTDWFGPLFPGTANSLSNSQCTVNGVGTTAAGNGTNLTFSPNVSFTSAFTGVKNIYLTAVTVATPPLFPPWLPFGTFNVNGTGTGTGTGQAAATAVFPAAASGTAQTFTFSYTDSFGASDIRLVQASFTTPNTGQACTVAYNPVTGQLFLSPDSGAALLGPITPGTAGSSLANSLCGVATAGSSASATGSSLTLTLNMTFNSTNFAGVKTVSGSVQSAALSLQTFTNQLGTFTVSGTPSTGGGSSAFPVGVTYVPGAGFVAQYRDLAGISAIATEDILINTTYTGVNACWVRYDAVNNLLYLRKDDNSGWLGGNKPGDSSTPTLANSQCIVNTLQFQSSGSGTDVFDTFRIALTVPSAVRSVFLSATDTAGNSSGVLTALTTTLP